MSITITYYIDNNLYVAPRARRQCIANKLYLWSCYYIEREALVLERYGTQWYMSMCTYIYMIRL